MSEQRQAEFDTGLDGWGLDQSGELLVCSTHGARFWVMDGKCVEGPCEGASLEPLRVKVSDGKIMLAGADTA